MESSQASTTSQANGPPVADPNRIVQSVWRCRWCGATYQHPITGAIVVGHFCTDVRHTFRKMTRAGRSIYDEIAADQRNPRPEHDSPQDPTVVPQGSMNADSRFEGRKDATWGQTPVVAFRRVTAAVSGAATQQNAPAGEPGRSSDSLSDEESRRDAL